MMKDNELVPEIEKLEHHDFDLDVEEQTRLQEEGDAEVARVSADILPSLELPRALCHSRLACSFVQV